MTKTTVRNPEVIREEFRDISIVDVKQAFDDITAHFAVHYEEQFEMATNKLGVLTDEQGNEMLKVYTYSPNHDDNIEMVIETYSAEAQAEIETLDWAWHNLIVS